MEYFELENQFQNTIVGGASEHQVGQLLFQTP